MKTNLILLIVAVGSVVGSFVAGPQLASLNVSNDHDHGLKQSQVAEAATLPLAVDWHYKIREKVGDAAANDNVKIDDGYIDAENHCEICTRIEYTPGSMGQAGLAYAFDRALDLSGAQSITFFMMGEEGGEKVKFKAGGKGATQSSAGSADTTASGDNSSAPGRGNERRPGAQSDALPPGLFKQQFALTTEEVQLENDWRKYTIDLEGLDLKSVTHPFGIEFPGNRGAQKQVVIIKHIVYDNEPPVNPLAASTANQTALFAEQGLSVDVIANATNGTAPAAIEFRPNVSGGVAPYSLHWDFGNGNDADTEQESTQTEGGQTLTEIFDQPGSYNVTLEVEDSLNQTGSSSIVIDIEPGETAAAVDMVIEANATESAAPAAIEFEAEVDSDDAETFELQWDFGDGTTAEGEASESTVHTFEEAGSYNVTANATGPEGQSASSWIVIEVVPALTDDASPATDDSETIDNSTSDEADEELEEEDDTVSNSTLEDQDNTPPSAGAIDNILAYPGDTVILDASQSGDEEGDELTYQWAQSSGPDVEIADADTSTPLVEVPDDIEEDDEIVMEVTVSDEASSAEPYPVTINVDFVEAAEETQDEGAEELELAPESEVALADWESDCDDTVECLSDGEEDTFLSASGSIDETDRPELLLSFEDFSDEELDEIHYVELRADASKSDVTGYLSFLIGEDGEQEPLFASDLVSIVTDPDDFGEYRLLLEEDPRTDNEWTLESVNSLLAGIAYAGGQSEVEVSEFSVAVVYSTAPIEEVEPEPAEEESVPAAELESQLEDEESEDAAQEDQEASNEEIPEDEAQEDTSENSVATNSTQDEP